MADFLKATRLDTSWVGAEDLPVQFANAFAGVVAPNAVFLTIGTSVPPNIEGDTQEEREAQVRALDFVPIKPIARLALAPQGLDDLIRSLEETRENYQNLRKAIDSGELEQ